MSQNCTERRLFGHDGLVLPEIAAEARAHGLDVWASPQGLSEPLSHYGARIFGWLVGCNGFGVGLMSDRLLDLAAAAGQTASARASDGVIADKLTRVRHIITLTQQARKLNRVTADQPAPAEPQPASPQPPQSDRGGGGPLVPVQPRPPQPVAPGGMALPLPGRPLTRGPAVPQRAPQPVPIGRDEIAF